ncbi:hypothetical protein FA95DRAFT_1463018, partial [Auriscalpium vulgare]
WAAIMEAWCVFEELLGFKNGTGKNFQLATTDRPDAVKFWVARKREMEKTPSIIKDARAFGKGWRAWWIALQPEWRGTTWPLRRSGGAASEAWTETAKGGRNGFEILLISVIWW